MDAIGLRELYDHHAWALDTVLGSAAHVPLEQAAAKPWEGVPSLNDALKHIVTAEHFWRWRWQGGEEPPPWGPPQPVAVVARSWRLVQAGTRAFLADLEDADLARPIELAQAVGGGRDTLGATIAHVLLHAGQHRAEAAALLSEYGHSPGELDYIVFLEARSLWID